MCLSQCFFWIFDARGCSQTVGELSIQDGKDLIYSLAWVKPINRNTSQAFCGLIHETFQRVSKPAHFLANDPHNFTGIPRKDWTAGDTLYAWALEVNNVHLNVVLDDRERWILEASSRDDYLFRTLGRECSSEAKLSRNLGLLWEYSAEWEPNDRCVSPDNNVVVAAQGKKRQRLFSLDLEQCVVLPNHLN